MSIGIFNHFITLRISGIKIGYLELKRYKKESINLESLTRALIVIKKGKLKLSKQEIIDSLKEKYNTDNIVRLLLFVKKYNFEFTFEDAKRGDRLGIDYNKEITSSENFEQTIKEIKQTIYSNT